MNILITGCAGFIGFSLIRELIKNKKYKIFGIDNLNNISGDLNLKKKRLNLIKKNIKFFNFCLEDKNKVKKIFKKYKFKNVIHLAAQPGVRLSIKDPTIYFNSNINGYFNILELSREYNVAHLIYASSSSVYGNQKFFPISETHDTNNQESFYGLSKKIGEMMSLYYSKMYSMRITSLRFFTVYGPYGRPDMAMFKFTEKIHNNKKIDIYNNGRHIRDFTYISNIIDPIIKILTKKRKKLYEVYNLASSKPEKLKKYIKELEIAFGKTAKKNYVELQLGDVLKTSASTKKIDKFTGKLKKIGISQGISNFVNWYKNYSK